MNHSNEKDKDHALWQNLLERETAFIQARTDFIKGARNPVVVIREALRIPSQRGTALRFLYLHNSRY